MTDEQHPNLTKFRKQINEIDPYFSTLTELRDQLANLFGTYFAPAKK